LRLLFVDVAVLSPRERFARGYVSVRDGRIEDLGEGEPPAELRVAELVGGGHGRLVVPGFIALAAPVLYPFRGLGVGLRVEDLLDYREAYYAALMGLYELSVSGYPVVLAVTTKVSAVADAMRAAGVTGAVLIPFGPSYPALESDELEKARSLAETGKIRVYAMKCGGETPEGLKAIDCMEPAGWTGSPWIELCRLDNPEERLRKYWGMLGYGEPLEKGSEAHLVVLDLTEPPAWTPSMEPGWEWLRGSTPRVEMVVAGGQPIVDGGQHLYIGLSDCEKAREVLAEALDRVKNHLG